MSSPNIFKTVALSSSTGETSIWDPGANKFRLMGGSLFLTGPSRVNLTDGSSGTVIYTFQNTTTNNYTFDLGQGIKSTNATTNNELYLIRLTTDCGVVGMVWGTEES